MLKTNVLSSGKCKVKYLTDNWVSIVENEQKLNDRTEINQ